MRRAYLTVDLGFGDSGKGGTVDWLARTTGAKTVVRFNGGCQAAHNVVLPDGRSHIFSQFGSGTLAGLDTFLSRFVMIDPLAVLNEAKHLEECGVGNPLSRLTVDSRCLLTTPYHKAANRLRELSRGHTRHGSCGVGIGETVQFSLQRGKWAPTVGDLLDWPTLVSKLDSVRMAYQAEFLWAKQPALARPHYQDLHDPDIWDFTLKGYESFIKQVNIAAAHHLSAQFADSDSAVIFEAAQGVLLDESYGFHPHTTWSKTTLANADVLLGECSLKSIAITRLGVLRVYATRHGRGPFPTYDPGLTHDLPDRTNGGDEWRQSFRVGFPDLALLQYAKQVVGHLDGLAVTCCDRLPDRRGHMHPKVFKVCRDYEDFKFSIPTTQTGQEALTRDLFAARPIYEMETSTEALVERFVETTGAPLMVGSWGPTHLDKIINPAWSARS